jgi:hypothetical protein
VRELWLWEYEQGWRVAMYLTVENQGYKPSYFETVGFILSVQRKRVA